MSTSYEDKLKLAAELRAGTELESGLQNFPITTIRKSHQSHYMPGHAPKAKRRKRKAA